ncbi:YcxB family protein [Flammeovirga sp. MY04]|uniref:YcxB family protein n=1 Tax=Flammeovirga sp. MY04 TaxID=1191459 RepID=UPI0008062EEE|nr:YcxB family protein [Flammeovirga sp. MY04]
MNISFNQQISLKDYKGFRKNYAFKNLKQASYIIIVPFIIFLLYVFTYKRNILQNLFISLSDLKFYRSLFFNFEFVIILFFTSYLIKYFVDNSFSWTKDYNNEVFYGEKSTITINKDFLIVKGEEVSRKIKWEKIDSVEEFQGWFILFKDKKLLFLILKSDFDSTDDLRSFKQFLKNDHQIKKVRVEA